ncbi:MAG TPA: LysR family transcriptional regulator [Candidatus Aminicenantes bacterium]|nr:LysR family transcriptional regulator [Candidatus Aminicenantes bacterium]
MALDLYQLKVYWTFARIRNVSHTAERLFVTQSAVSHALKKLAGSVGRPLFTRRGGEYELTEAGEELFRTCDRIFGEIDRCEALLRGEGGVLRQKLVLGAPVEFGTTVLVRELARFIPQHPTLHLHCYFSHHLHAPLMKDELDLMVDCHPCHHRDVERIFLFRERYAVIASPQYLAGHPLQKPADLARATVLSIDERGEWWNNFVLALPEERRTVLTHIVQINHVRGLINGALAGIGVAFVPRYTVQGELREGLLIDLFPGAGWMDDQFCVYVKRDRRAAPGIGTVIDFLLATFTGFEA